MKKIATSGKRYIKNDQWHDDRGAIPGHPGLWDPPMTEDEVMAAALSDPDAQPLTDAQLARMRRIAFAKHVRFKVGLSQEAFAERFGIPLGTLRDWEQHRTEPDTAAQSYLKVILKDPDAVARALKDAVG